MLVFLCFLGKQDWRKKQQESVLIFFLIWIIILAQPCNNEKRYKLAENENESIVLRRFDYGCGQKL